MSKLLAEETLHKDRADPSSETPRLVRGLSGEVNAEEVTALAIAVTDAGSFSGGECFQRSRGFMSRGFMVSRAGVPALLGMSMALG